MSARKKNFGRRLPPKPPKIITNAPDGLSNGSGLKGVKRSEWIALGVLGASVLGVFAVAEGVNQHTECSPPPQASALNTADSSANCRSSGSSHGGGGGGWGGWGSKGSSSSGAHFGGFGAAGGGHGGGGGE